VVQVTIRYRLIFAGSYEAEECGEALVAVDGRLVSGSANEYLARSCGLTGSDPAQDTGWQQASFTLPLGAGSHTLTIGAWNNAKTAGTELTAVYFENVVVWEQDQPVLESECTDGRDNDSDGRADCLDEDCAFAEACAAEIRSGFDVDADGFTYADDLFATNHPAYARGNYTATDGYDGGGLKVTVGGIDSTDIVNGMSGGWQHDFSLAAAEAVRISLRYRLVVSGGYEPDECGEVLLAIDDTLVSDGSFDYLARFCGMGDGNPDQDSGWRQASVSIPLAAGVHTLGVGAYNNKKTSSNERTEVYIDDIVVVRQGDLLFSESDCSNGSDDDRDGFTDCADLDCDNVAFCEPGVETSCSDRQDNDGDRLTDCSDTDCAGHSGCGYESFILHEDFGSGAASRWAVFDNSGKASAWTVSGGVYMQETLRVDSWVSSYPIGSYSYFLDGFSLRDYRLRVRMRSLAAIDGGRDIIGVMFRYQNSDNYYRLIMSRHQGFSRLEKRVAKSFATLAADGRGFASKGEVEVEIEVNGSTITVQVNGEPRFAVHDTSLASGSVALFTQAMAEFDDVDILAPETTPTVVLSQPLAHSVATRSFDSPVLEIACLPRALPVQGGVELVLDEATSSEVSLLDYASPWGAQLCADAPAGESCSIGTGDHTVSAYIVDQFGTRLLSSAIRMDDFHAGIGTGGKYLVAFGDSITNGYGDDYAADNDSADRRNLNRGFEPVLNDLLAAQSGQQITVLNEGVGGTTSANGASRISSTLSRHPLAQYWLILFGTNDSGVTVPIMSGKECSEADLKNNVSTCVGTYKYNLRRMALAVQSAGKVPLLAKVPYIRGAPPARDQLLRDYNVVIDQLVAEHDLPAPPPDLYSYFKNHQSEYFDDKHPNGTGYRSIAALWLQSLTIGGLAGE